MPRARLKSGLTIHYAMVGEGPDLVMIHGLSGNLAVWHLTIVPLLREHFRILTYDLRGHGASEMPASGYTADDMVTDLGYLLEALGVHKASIVGHSYGADIALYFAHRYPQRVARVVAIEAALPALIQLRKQKDWEGWAFWADVLERSGCTVPPERRYDLDYLLRLSLQVPRRWGPLRGLPRNPQPLLRLLDTTTVVEEYEVVGTLTLERISHLTTPVLLVYSQDSAFAGTGRYLGDRLPNARSVLLPKSEWGHFAPLEQPEIIASHILTFLEPSAPVVVASQDRGLP